MDETNTLNTNRPPQDPLGMDRNETRVIAIEGMTCGKCVEKVDKALRGKRGVKNVRVDQQKATATVTFDRTETDIPALHEALLAAGYKPTRTTEGS